MKRIIGVKFKGSGKTYYFDPQGLDIKAEDSVIVETARGIVFGVVSEPPHMVIDEQVVNPLKPVIRIATETDKQQNANNLDKEEEAFEIGQRKIEERELPMKQVDVEYAFNGSKITFYFSSESRVDFRELLKDLSRTFKTSIELRQIGVRDEARKYGGLGSCGMPICCNTFLTNFAPVSIKMAKTQNLSLSSPKISGACGRLMCCLKYEQDCYESMQHIMPSINTECRTPDGIGTVLENNVITETTKVKVALPDGTFEIRTYPFRDLEYKSKCKCESGNSEQTNSDNEAALQGKSSKKSKKCSDAAENAPCCDDCTCDNLINE